MEEAYSSIMGKTFSGKYMGLKPDDTLGLRKVFEVNPDSNEEIQEAIEQLKIFTSGNAQVILIVLTQGVFSSVNIYDTS